MSGLVYERTEKQIQIDAEILARVKAGIAWLEETAGPNWVDKIDLGTLNLQEGSSCVCGQVFREQTGKKKNERDEWFYENGYDYAEDHMDDNATHKLGFLALRQSEWEELQKTWEYVLTPMVSRG